MDAIKRAVEWFRRGQLTAAELEELIANVRTDQASSRNEIDAYLGELVAKGELAPEFALRGTSPGLDDTLGTAAAGTFVREAPVGERLPLSSATDDTAARANPAIEPAADVDPFMQLPDVPVATQLRATVPIAPPTIATAPAAAGGKLLAEGVELRARYRLIERIGQGAMGQVWKAKDLLGEEARERNPFIAIKVLNSDFEAHPESFVAMHREASRAQKLAHPNVVTVYTFDRDDISGRAFIAMELLDGEPLDRVIRNRHGSGLPREEALPIIAGMAEGLGYAHRRGIVHADFKPANVFLTRDGVPKILDFGIARAAQVVEGVRREGPDEDAVFSGFTITYAAPEVLEEKEPHTADDVFALGLVAYELLSGSHPFARRPANEARDAKVKPKPLRDVKRREWKAIEKALAFERAERWPDAASFSKSLQGATPLQKVLAGAVAILAVAAAGLWYQNYRETQPTIPFEQLPDQQRADVQRWLAQGNESLRIVGESKIIEASADAAYEFAEAYRIHPRNPDAVKGLEEAADYFIEWWDAQPDRSAAALGELKAFQAKSDYYLKYRPLVRAIEDLEER